MIEASLPSSTKPAIDLQLLAQARQQAVIQKAPVIKILEDIGNYSPNELLEELGQLLRMPVLKMEDLHELQPAFDILSFAEAVKQECALFRREHEYILAVSDPFKSHLYAWA